MKISGNKESKFSYEEMSGSSSTLTGLQVTSRSIPVLPLLFSSQMTPFDLKLVGMSPSEKVAKSPLEVSLVELDSEEISSEDTDGDNKLEESDMMPNLRLLGASKEDFLRALRAFVSSKVPDKPGDNHAASAVAANLCNQIYVDNDKSFYVLITDDSFGSLVMTTLQSYWEILIVDDTQPEDTTIHKDAVQKEDQIALQIIFKIGTFKFSAFVFSPVNVTFAIHKQIGELCSIFYHGITAGEVVEYFPQRGQSRFCVSFLQSDSK